VDVDLDGGAADEAELGDHPLVGDGQLRGGVADGIRDPEQETDAIEGQKDQSECQQRYERSGADQVCDR
jgi:hypothetical protein